MRSFTWKFDELPLAIINGIEAGLIDGRIEVEYTHDADWQLVKDSVQVEGYKKLTWAERDAGKKPWVFVPAPEDMARTIIARLENEWSDKVFSAVQDQIAEDREEAAEYRAEQRREDRAGVW